MKPKKAKKKKKGKFPKGPTRWDEVNLDNDRRYFDVSDNLEEGNAASQTSLSDQEPPPSASSSSHTVADFSRLELIDPITQQTLTQSTLSNLVESAS